MLKVPNTLRQYTTKLISLFRGTPSDNNVELVHDIEELVLGFYDSVPMEFVNMALRMLACDQYLPQTTAPEVEFTQMRLVVHRAGIQYRLIGAAFIGGSLSLGTRVTITTKALDSDSVSTHVFEKCLLVTMRRFGTMPHWSDRCLSVPVESLDDPAVRASLYLSSEAETWLRMIYLAHKDSPGHERYLVTHTDNVLLSEALLQMKHEEIEIVTPLAVTVADDSIQSEVMDALDIVYTDAKRMGFTEMSGNSKGLTKGVML